MATYIPIINTKESERIINNIRTKKKQCNYDFLQVASIITVLLQSKYCEDFF